MKINKFFNLKKSQRELDFINIDVNRDIPLFIDPYFLANRKDSWSIKATRDISDFFHRVIHLVKKNKKEEAKRLFEYLREPNQTCLGLSQGKPKGRGVGKDNANEIFRKLLRSKSIETGLVQDLEDSIIFVEGIGKDKLSDMTTNIIRKELIKYTQEQCKLWNIPLTKDIPSGFYWDINENEWKNEYTEMLLVNNKSILLVPKGVVSYSDEYTPSKYYNHFVLNFLQNEHLRLNTALVQYRKNKDKFVTKKSIKEETPYSKEFLRRFTRNNTEIFEQFKKTMKEYLIALDDDYFEFSNISEIADKLIKKLNSIKPGNDGATEYHRAVKGILEFIFYPSLIHPVLENEIHQGRKRIDITFDNAASNGIFFRLHTLFKLPSQYIYFECKNYNSDPRNPELDQLAGRFSINRGKVGFLLCRQIENLNLFLQRCNDTYKDDRGLIIPITDKDIKLILNNIKQKQFKFIDEYLSNRVRKIIH